MVPVLAVMSAGVLQGVQRNRYSHAIVHWMLPISCRYTVSATLRIGCDRQVGSSVMGKLQLGYVVLQLALLTHPNACQAQLLQNRFHYQTTAVSVETVLEVAVALRQEDEGGSPDHM